MPKIISRFKRMNWTLTAAIAALSAMGCIFIRSAGAARAAESLQTLWQSHLCTALAGFILYFALAAIDYRKLFSWAAVPFYAASAAMLVAVLFVGEEVYGGKRWLWFFQPGEIAKLAVIMLLAQIFGAAPANGAADWRQSLRGFAVAALAFGAPAALILLEPDLGSALALAPAVLAMLFAARVWTKGLILLCAAGVFAAGAILGAVSLAERESVPEKRAAIMKWVPLREHQVKRLRVFIDPGKDIYGAGYNLRQAKLSIGSGGMFGKGVGMGEQKALGYLPPSVSMNDFIFAVLAEESGFSGAALMLALFLALLLSGLNTARLADDDRGRIYAVGVLTLVFCHVWENVAMSIGLMPITGLPLPFISAGRTFLVVLMAALGILQSVHLHRGGAAAAGEAGATNAN